MRPLVSLSVWLLFMTLASSGPSQTPQSATLPLDVHLGLATLPLWRDGAPGAHGTDPLDVPTLTVFRPVAGAENGTAVIIAPGGGYVNLSSNLEGRQVADWFATRGITAYVLRYRLGAKYPFPIPLLDAQRAVRLVRSLAATSPVNPGRIGFVGFSAGGHLAALTGTKFDDGDAQAADPVDRLGSRPDFLVLGYPWINAMQNTYKGMITYCSLIPTTSPADCKRFDELYTPLHFVTGKTPPTFLYATTDDQVVPAKASEEMYTALREQGVSAELHIFRHGAHGSGLGKGDAVLGQWPALLEAWLRDQGWLTPDPSIAQQKSQQKR